MAIISLYNKDESNFSHVGTTIQPISCVVELEDNGGYFADLEFLITEKIEKGMIVKIQLPWAEPQLFRLGKIDKKKDRKTVTANHIFYDLLFNFLEDVRPTQLSCGNALNYILARTTEPNDFRASSNIYDEDTSYFIRKNVVWAIFSIVEQWKGHIIRDNKKIAVNNSIGSDKGLRIEYGYNMQDISEITDWESVVTKIRPLGKNELSLPEVYITSDINYEIPYIKTVEFDIEQGDEETLAEAQERLRVEATKYLNENKYPRVNYTLSAYLEGVTSIGDTIYVHHEILGIDLKTNVIKLKYNAISDKYISIEFGNFKQNISSTFSNISAGFNEIIKRVNKSDGMTKAIESVTKQLQSALGGHVIKREDELLISDNLDLSLAQKIWRWNLNGLGFSNSGINGDFPIAITADGQIVADFITTGQLSVERVVGLANTLNNISIGLDNITNTVESHSETIENIVNEVSDQNSYLPAVFIPFATPVTFNNIVNGSFNVNTFTKGATNAWDAGFTTVETFENGSYVEFKVTELTAAYMIGFNNGTNDANYTSIDCCAYKTASTLYAYTNGSNKGKIATVAVNDLIRVVIANGFYSIYVNDKVVFTSYVKAVLPAYVDASITTANASISNIVCGVFTAPSLRAQSEASVIAAGYANLNALTAQSTADSAITNAGVANELARAMAYGKMLLLDPTFKTGNNNMSTYNNSANTNVTRTWIDKPTDCPTTSAKAIQIQTIGTASPGWGGFYLGTMSRANGIFITRIIAKIPVGYSIAYANNAIGTGGAIKWLTSVAGTGNYQEYILKTTCGSTGTFSSFNFFYLTGSPTPTPASPLNWFVGYCTCFDLTDNDYSVVNINNTLSDIASDSKLTPDEKQLLKKEWDVIVSEVVLNDTQATSFELLSEKASYDTAYSTLNTYITPLLSDLTVTTDIIGATLRTNFKTYYDARTNLLNAIATKAKLLADTAQSTANNAQSTVDNLGNSVNEQFLNINNRSAVIEQTLNGVNTKVQEYNETLNTHTGEIVSLKDKSEELEVAVSGITNTLRETGGLNLWKDAVFLFGGENWDGTSFVSATNTDIIDNTKSGNAIHVQNRTWSQTIQAKNGTYTNSYLFKKLIALAVVTVTINGVTKTLTGTDWTAEIFTFNVTNRSITITITSDTANSAYISDLMLNSGSSVQVWGLNQNETFTDTVQIGKGIKITASGTDTELNATSDAIRIKKKSTGSTITDFTDKGLSTKDMTSDTATIGKLLIQNINGQVCFNNIGGA